MRTKDIPRCKHEAFAQRTLGERGSIFDLRNQAHTNIPAFGGPRASAPSFEHAIHVRARSVKSIPQSRQKLSVVTIRQHPVRPPFGELRAGDAGQHFDVGNLVGA